MTLWRKVRSEVAGAWRSMRYDLGRRPAEPPSGGPDVTSTGMYTFGGQLDQEPIPVIRPARHRTVAVTGLSALAFAAAAGAYLAVMNGFGTHDQSAAAETIAQQPSTAVATTQVTAVQGLGPGPARVRTRPDEARPTASHAQVAPVPPPLRAPITTVPAPVSRTSASKCLCAPPVPTPTAPTASPSPTTSTVKSSPSPAASSASPSATDGEWAFPPDSPQARHRWRHH